jgi:poly [ADP-ribose] polymerase
MARFSFDQLGWNPESGIFFGYVFLSLQGLRIAPPEAPVTGYMFGKGVYFADSSSKSANYWYC